MERTNVAMELTDVGMDLTEVAMELSNVAMERTDVGLEHRNVAAERSNVAAEQRNDETERYSGGEERTGVPMQRTNGGEEHPTAYLEKCSIRQVRRRAVASASDDWHGQRPPKPTRAITAPHRTSAGLAAVSTPRKGAANRAVKGRIRQKEPMHRMQGWVE